MSPQPSNHPRSRVLTSALQSCISLHSSILQPRESSCPPTSSCLQNEATNLAVPVTSHIGLHGANKVVVIQRQPQTSPQTSCLLSTHRPFSGRLMQMGNGHTDQCLASTQITGPHHTLKLDMSSSDLSGLSKSVVSLLQRDPAARKRPVRPVPGHDPEPAPDHNLKLDMTVVGRVIKSHDRGANIQLLDDPRIIG